MWACVKIQCEKFINQMWLHKLWCDKNSKAWMNGKWTWKSGRGQSAYWGFSEGSEVKASACNAGDLGSIPGSGRSPGEGNGNPLQYSCLENPMDGGVWWAAVYGVAQSRTRLKQLSSSSSSVHMSIPISQFIPPPLPRMNFSLKFPDGSEFLANMSNSSHRERLFLLQEGKPEGQCNEIPVWFKIISRGWDKFSGCEHIYAVFHSTEMTQNSEGWCFSHPQLFSGQFQIF